ncbi:MAG: FtsX-like permease family protein [Elusimicrobiota bacterium]|nr:FtsX-like permease family protein [Endomicrobiia bacterium]MDW8165445.1 FtsX-like permease family protein [Elusimicrobiota bacterium]
MIKKFFDIVFRNIKRNKRRTLLAVISVSLAVMFVVILQGLVDGMVENIIKNSTKNETGHIRITSKEYLRNIQSPSLQHLIYNPQEVINYILSDKNLSKQIKLVTERIKFFVILRYQNFNKTALCIAGDIEKEKELLMLNKSIIEGEYLTKKSAKKGNRVYREVIIGEKLAKIMNLKVGDTFSLMLQRVDFSIKIPSFYVRGIFKTGLNMLDENVFMMNIEDAKDLLNTDDAICEILLMLKKYHKAEELTEHINQLLSKKKEYEYLIASDWKETSGFVKMINQAVGIYDFLYIAVTFLGSFIITNIILMIVLERRREIGILKSMGFKKFHILFLFTLEGTILGTIGSIFGAILGTIINIPLSIYGIDFSSMGSMNYPMDNVIRWSINLTSILLAVILGVVVSSIMSILPSRYAAKMKPVDALKTF